VVEPPDHHRLLEVEVQILYLAPSHQQVVVVVVHRILSERQEQLAVPEVAAMLQTKPD
jgi:hypothetical protein